MSEMSELQYALCDEGHLVSIPTCNGFCPLCGVMVWPRSGLTITSSDCQCGNPSSHYNSGLCPVMLVNMSSYLQVMKKTEKTVVSKPYVEFKPNLNLNLSLFGHAAVVAAEAFNSATEWEVRHSLPRQKTFDLEGTAALQRFYYKMKFGVVKDETDGGWYKVG